MNDREGSGCAALLAWVLLIALVFGAVISLAAVVDPFSKLPTPAAIWADCREAPGKDGSCELAHRFPGFWGHVAVSLGYSFITAAAVCVLVGATVECRTARRERFDDTAVAQRFGNARRALMAAVTGVAALGLVPVVVAAS